MINLELYKIFYYTATSKSFSDAAKKMFITQSAVSQSIKTLEKNLNTTLFFRNTKKMHLTKEGVLLLKHIEPALNMIKIGEKNIQEISVLKKGEIHIGASDTICRYFLLPYIEKFHKEYPQIQLQITNRTSPMCVELLKQGLVNFIITNLPNSKINNNMITHKIHSFKDVFVTGKTLYEKLPSVISLEDLKNHPILLLEQNTTTRNFFDTIIKEKVNITPEVELGSIDLLIDLAKIDLGISFVPDFCIKNKKDIFLLNTKETYPSRSLGITYSKNFPLSVASEKFLRHMKINK